MFGTLCPYAVRVIYLSEIFWVNLSYYSQGTKSNSAQDTSNFLWAFEELYIFQSIITHYTPVSQLVGHGPILSFGSWLHVVSVSKVFFFYQYFKRHPLSCEAAYIQLPLVLVLSWQLHPNHSKLISTWWKGTSAAIKHIFSLLPFRYEA